MAVRGSVLTLGVVLCLAAPGTGVDAQFGNPLKRLRPQPAAPKGSVVQCQTITDKDIDQLLKAFEAEQAMQKAQQDRRAEAHQRQRATEEAVGRAATDRMMAAMARQAACEQAAMEKDPRFREANRIGELMNKAQDRGDEAAADKYGQQFEELNDAVGKAAKAACLDQPCLARARQESPLRKQVDEMRAAAARSADPQHKAMLEAQIPAYLGMIENEAIQTCGPGGAAALTAAEQAQTDAAAAAAHSARSGTDESAAEKVGMSKEDYGRLFDCACGALGGDPSRLAISDASRQAIESRRTDLQPALDRSGKCGRG